MKHEPAIQTVIQQYLDSVASVLGSTPAEHRKAILRELREHFDEALVTRTSGGSATLQDAYAVLSTMDPPTEFTDETLPAIEVPTSNTKLVALSVICSVLQVVGLAAVVNNVPVVGAVAGFAAIVNFFLNWSNGRTPRWSLRLSGTAAICGLGMILIELARAM